ncbi:hypothetical protein PG997_007415 [Apiospora hydei]|uniref:Uncharacterized protein n=1 Tax=Apiospora hydei TaxID=1337664 RepID=A0ABR1W976_9PEZI
MVNVTGQGQDEAARLARSRARMPRINLEYQLPVTKATLAPALKVGNHPSASSVTKKRRTRKAVKKPINPPKCWWYELPLESTKKPASKAPTSPSTATPRGTGKPPSPSHTRTAPAPSPACCGPARASTTTCGATRSSTSTSTSSSTSRSCCTASSRAPLPRWALEHVTHVDLEPRRVTVRCPGRAYSTTSAFQVLVGADDVPATAPDPDLVVAALPQVLPRLQQLRVIFSWHTDAELGVVPVAKHVIRELIAISDLRDRVPGKHHHHNDPSMVPKRDDFTFGFVVAVKFESWRGPSDPQNKGKEVYHKWCVHCFINEYRSKDGPIKKYGGKLRNMLKGVEWCVSTENHRAFRREKLE